MITQGKWTKHDSYIYADTMQGKLIAEVFDCASVGMTKALMAEDITAAEAAENAKFIVKACNSHDTLVKQNDLLVLGLLQEKRLTSAFSTFVDSVKTETHSMSFEKMHPTLKMLFNHLLSHLKFAEQSIAKATYRRAVAFN